MVTSIDEFSEKASLLPKSLLNEAPLTQLRLDVGQYEAAHALTFLQDKP